MELPSVSDIEMAMIVDPMKKSGTRLEYAVPLTTPWLQFQSLSEKPLRFASILVALTGTEHQDEHQDDPSDDGERVIVYLTDVTSADDGALELAGVPQLGERGTIIRYTTRDMHRGLANTGTMPRIALGLAFSHNTKPVLTIGNVCDIGFVFLSSGYYQSSCEQVPLPAGFENNSLACSSLCGPTCSAYTLPQNLYEEGLSCYICSTPGPELVTTGYWSYFENSTTCLRTSAFDIQETQGTPSSSSTPWFTWLFLGLFLFFLVVSVFFLIRYVNVLQMKVPFVRSNVGL